MLSNAYFLAKFRFDTAENEPAKILQKIVQNLPILLTLTAKAAASAWDSATLRAFETAAAPPFPRGCARAIPAKDASERMNWDE